MQTVKPFLFLGNSPLYIELAFCKLSQVKVGFFSERPKYQSFSSLTMATPSYLKSNKLLVKISHFKFLVMTEKNIFVYKTFLSLINI